MISHKTFVSLSDMEARMTDRCEQEKMNSHGIRYAAHWNPIYYTKGVSLFAALTPIPI